MAELSGPKSSRSEPIRLEPFSLDRMVRAVQIVRERLLRAIAVLHEAGVEHAVVGANAVSAWVATVDAGAVRNTPDVDLLIDRHELDRASAVLKEAGFFQGDSKSGIHFLDSPTGRLRDSIRIHFAGELLTGQPPFLGPTLDQSVQLNGMTVLSLEPLV
jgi:hypothetical protein